MQKDNDESLPEKSTRLLGPSRKTWGHSAAYGRWEDRDCNEGDRTGQPSYDHNRSHPGLTGAMEEADRRGTQPRGRGLWRRREQFQGCNSLLLRLSLSESGGAGKHVQSTNLRRGTSPTS